MSTHTGKSSDHSQAIDAFNHNGQLFRALIENSSDAIALVSPEGLFTYVSPSVQKILGFTPEELRGKSTLELFPPDHLARALEQFEAVAKTPGLTATVEHAYIHKDGSLRWLESTITNHLHDPTIHAFVANFRDITQRKHAEERQRLLDEASNALVSSLDHQISLREIAQLIVPAFADYCRIAILDEQQQIKEISVNHIDPQQIALVRELYERYKDRTSSTHGLQRLLQTGKAELISNVSESVLETVRDSPELLGIIKALGLQSYMGTPLMAGDRVIGAITFSSVQLHRHYTHDDLVFGQELARRIALVLENARFNREAQEELAERKQAEEKLRQLEQRKDEFISIASHELKTPVTSLKGFTNLLQRRLGRQGGDEQTLHYLSRMNAQLDKLNRLISELLDVSRIQTGKLAFQEEPFDLALLVHETVENLQAGTETHQILVEGTGSVPVYGDKDRLGQVLINLLTNAIKYSPDADKVIVCVSNDRQVATVSVQDFGIGIAESHQQHIFERFYQVIDPAEKTYHGLGIGLYIPSEIVKRHHGRLWVESKKGQGATFYMRLPVALPHEQP